MRILCAHKRHGLILQRRRVLDRIHKVGARAVKFSGSHTCRRINTLNYSYQVQITSTSGHFKTNRVRHWRWHGHRSGLRSIITNVGHVININMDRTISHSIFWRVKEMQYCGMFMQGYSIVMKDLTILFKHVTFACWLTGLKGVILLPLLL